MAFIILFMITKNRQNLPTFYYQAMAVLPLLASGMAIGWIGFTKKLFFFSEKKASLRRLLRSVPLFLGLFMVLGNFAYIFNGRLPTRNTPWVVSDMHAYEQAAQWLNQRTKMDDLVITYRKIS